MKNVKQHKLSNHKTESIRDLMLGKKSVKKLPFNFFENVAKLEFKIKKNFNLDILQDLVSFYSVYY